VNDDVAIGLIVFFFLVYLLAMAWIHRPQR
jgi:cbb3-type cytochrome oxidase subunit 3